MLLLRPYTGKIRSGRAAPHGIPSTVYADRRDFSLKYTPDLIIATVTEEIGKEPCVFLSKAHTIPYRGDSYQRDWQGTRTILVHITRDTLSWRHSSTRLARILIYRRPIIKDQGDTPYIHFITQSPRFHSFSPDHNVEPDCRLSIPTGQPWRYANGRRWRQGPQRCP